MDFGNKLKEARIKKGLSQQELADRLFVTRQTVSRWESGNRYPDYDTLNRISAELDIGASELLGQKELNDMTISAANGQKSMKVMVISVVSFVMSIAVLAVSVAVLIHVKRTDTPDIGAYDKYAREVYRVPDFCGRYVCDDTDRVFGELKDGFTLCLFADGSFSYYETMLSSYLGFGLYTLDDDGRIVIRTDDGKFINSFIYSADDDALIFVADGSTNFLYKKLSDGAVFRRSTDSNDGIFIIVDR